jgi:epoxyqueuosine reductase
MSLDVDATLAWLQTEAGALGFSALGVADTELATDAEHLQRWLDQGFHGELDYMARHGTLRSRPAELVPGTLRVISVRMNYWPDAAAEAWSVLGNAELGYIARYTLGRDYHRTLRPRLKQLCLGLMQRIGPFGYRVFVDSAPVLEKALARKAGLGWIGKHTNLIHREHGSLFLLGEIYTDLPLPAGAVEQQNHCGSCSACIDVCPTRAIVAPYRLDARRCIAYLTIEYKGSIPLELRPLIGNRIFGCDDCQLVCPWNRYAGRAPLADFAVRNGLDAPALVELLAWSEADYLRLTEGSALRRIGYPGWLRNVAVALGNGPATEPAVAALRERATHPEPVVREHVAWALEQLASRRAGAPSG